MTEGATPPEFFNPSILELMNFSSDRIASGEASHRHSATLAFGSRQAGPLKLLRVQVVAEGASAEPMTQHAAVRMLLDAIMVALHKERAGIQLNAPTPKGWGTETPALDRPA